MVPGADPTVRPAVPSRISGAAWALLALATAGLSALAVDAYLFRNAEVEAERMMPGPWYGNWGAVVFSVWLVSLVVLGFLRPPRGRNWRHLGLSAAFLVALFTEMFGIPFTIYLLGSLTGASFGLGMVEGHLWAVLASHLGLLPLETGVGLVMAISSVLITVGVALMAAGWYQTWRAVRAGGELVTDGLYRPVRHPQYAGFLLLALGFLVQWPTLPTLLLFPVLVVVYVRLARREERELEARFGEAWRAYRSRTPMLLPGWRSRAPARGAA